MSAHAYQTNRAYSDLSINNIQQSMKGIITEEQAYQKLSALCASAEHCSHEMAEKMRRWQMSEDTVARVMERLVSDKFVDDERYCRFFVRDKIRYNKWGRRKVEQALYMKRIPEDISARILDEVDPQTYIDILRPLLQAKRKSVKAGSDYELNGKLIRFALGRGFSIEEAKECLE